MKTIKKIRPFIFLSMIVLWVTSCNNEPKTSETNKKPAVAEKLDPQVEKLLTHFKESSNFPIVMDSAQISKAITCDSLGRNEIKMLAKEWYFDSNLELIFDYELKDFYTIDSLKSNGGYKEWAKKLDIGMTARSNAYALQQIKMNDTTTLLLWALHYSSYDADPVYNITHVFFSKLCHNKIIESFLLGQIAESADPPSSGQMIITGKLGQDGGLSLDKVNLVEDLDDMKGDVTRDHFEYIVTNGKLHFKTKSESTTHGIKVKS